MRSLFLSFSIAAVDRSRLSSEWGGSPRRFKICSVWEAEILSQISNSLQAGRAANKRRPEIAPNPPEFLPNLETLMLEPYLVSNISATFVLLLFCRPGRNIFARLGTRHRMESLLHALPRVYSLNSGIWSEISEPLRSQMRLPFTTSQPTFGRATKSIESVWRRSYGFAM